MSAATAFDLSLDSRNGIVRMALRGELDIVAAHVLSERLVSIEQEGATGILLDPGT
jgi:anti-anti-sigma regulatory factor